MTASSAVHRAHSACIGAGAATAVRRACAHAATEAGELASLVGFANVFDTRSFARPRWRKLRLSGVGFPLCLGALAEPSIVAGIDCCLENKSGLRTAKGIVRLYYSASSSSGGEQFGRPPHSGGGSGRGGGRGRGLPRSRNAAVTKRRMPGTQRCTSAKVATKPKPATRSTLHPRNSFKGSYDIPALCGAYPPLAPHVVDPVVSGQPPTINFSDLAAVRALNCALLVSDYGLSPKWADILPDDALLPPIPGRADYIHRVADALRATALGGNAESSADDALWDGIPVGSNVRILDVGTGASCVYPLLGSSTFGWSFVASEVHPPSWESACRVVKVNERLLSGAIDVRRQLSSNKILDGIWGDEEEVDFVMCNPPFYPSAEAFARESARKARNLEANSKSRRRKAKGQGGSVGLKRGPGDPSAAAGRSKEKGGGGSNNFGGSDTELWCPGGEVAFVTRLIRESKRYAGRCLWFSSVVSRKENLPKIEAELQERKRKDWRAGEWGSGPGRRLDGRKDHLRKRSRPGKGDRSIEMVNIVSMGPGPKSASVVMWSYLDEEGKSRWVQRRDWALRGR